MPLHTLLDHAENCNGRKELGGTSGHPTPGASQTANQCPRPGASQSAEPAAKRPKPVNQPAAGNVPALFQSTLGGSSGTSNQDMVRKMSDMTKKMSELSTQVQGLPNTIAKEVCDERERRDNAGQAKDELAIFLDSVGTSCTAKPTCQQVARRLGKTIPEHCIHAGQRFGLLVGQRPEFKYWEAEDALECMVCSPHKKLVAHFVPGVRDMAKFAWFQCGFVPGTLDLAHTRTRRLKDKLKEHVEGPGHKWCANHGADESIKALQRANVGMSLGQDMYMLLQKGWSYWTYEDLVYARHCGRQFVGSIGHGCEQVPLFRDACYEVIAEDINQYMATPREASC